MKAFFAILPFVFLLAIFTGCEGDAGAPGQNLLGDDIHPPAVELILPTSSRPYYSAACFEAIIQDDGQIDSVRFLINGKRDLFPQLITTTHPYQVWINDLGLAPGSYSVQAFAWDKAGHIGTSSWVMINVKDPADAPSIKDVSFFNPRSDGDLKWYLPDSTGQYQGFGSRITLDRAGSIRRLYVKLFRDEDWWGAVWKYEIRSSLQGQPDSLISEFIHDGNLMWRGEAPPDNEYWKRMALDGLVEVPKEFFILATLAEDQGDNGDTLAILTDEGYLRNNRGLILRDGEWVSFDSGPGTVFNPLIRLEMMY